MLRSGASPLVTIFPHNRDKPKLRRQRENSRILKTFERSFLSASTPSPPFRPPYARSPPSPDSKAKRKLTNSVQRLISTRALCDLQFARPTRRQTPRDPIRDLGRLSTTVRSRRVGDDSGDVGDVLTLVVVERKSRNLTVMRLVRCMSENWGKQREGGGVRR